MAAHRIFNGLGQRGQLGDVSSDAQSQKDRSRAWDVVAVPADGRGGAQGLELFLGDPGRQDLPGGVEVGPPVPHSLKGSGDRRSRPRSSSRLAQTGSTAWPRRPSSSR